MKNKDYYYYQVNIFNMVKSRLRGLKYINGPINCTIEEQVEDILHHMRLWLTLAYENKSGARMSEPELDRTKESYNCFINMMKHLIDKIMDIENSNADFDDESYQRIRDLVIRFQYTLKSEEKIDKKIEEFNY